MSTRKHCTLFLDTNTLLHYPPLAQMKWGLACEAQQVTLCLCITVIQELDKKKDDPRLANRARKRIKEIEAIINGEGQVAEDISLIPLACELRREDYPVGFSPDSADDSILLQAQIYAHEHTDTTVMVVSEDMGMMVKCVHHSIPLIKPQDAGHRLPDPNDTHSRKLNAALAELEKLKNTFPSLLVSICKASQSERGNKVSYTLQQVQPLDLKEELDRIRFHYPLDIKQPTTDFPVSSTFERLLQIAPGEDVRYRQEVDAYYTEYPKFVTAQNEYLDQKTRLLQISFILKNSGGAPAEDVDIHLHFPDGFELYGPDEFLSPPKEPKPPVRPRTQQQIFSDKFSGYRDIGSMFHLPELLGSPPNVSSPKIQKTNSYDVRYNVKKLKHGYETTLSTLEVRFPTFESAKSFEIDYMCSAANMPQAQEGTLHVVVGSISDCTQ